MRDVAGIPIVPRRLGIRDFFCSISSALVIDSLSYDRIKFYFFLE